jgi:hypothetical protein
MNTEHAASAHDESGAAFAADAPIPYTLTPKAEASLAAPKPGPQTEPGPEPEAG